MKKENQPETWLAEKVVDWLVLQKWKVYQEVQFGQGGNVADIVAIQGQVMWAIECKTTMTLAVMEQAHHWLMHYRSIAVPAVRNRDGRGFSYQIAKDYLKIGVLEVDDTGYVEERVNAPFQRCNNDWLKRRYLPWICEEQKTFAKAGSNNKDQYTPYKRTIISVREYIQKNPYCTIKQILDNVETHYSGTFPKASLRQALVNWEQSWCGMDTNGKETKYFFKVGSNG